MWQMSIWDEQDDCLPPNLSKLWCRGRLFRWSVCMIYPACKNGEHGRCPINYAGLVKCRCACHVVVGSGWDTNAESVSGQ